MRRPLEDVRIIAIEQYGAGPWATMQLADLGAEVIKIEDPAVGGDVGRYVPPFQDGTDSLFFESFNRNKKSVVLDIKDTRGRRLLDILITRSDAVFSNLRGDQPSRLGLTYKDLSSINPLIVCCALTGFGMTGPRAEEGGYDYVVQGLTGWMTLTGEPSAPPTKTGLSLVDLSAGYVAALALVAGVWRARRDGVGCDCDISLFDTAISELGYVGTWAASKRFLPERLPNSAHPSVVPFQNFRTSDGWIVIACPKEKFWVRLCEAIGRPDLATDERFADFAARYENRDALLLELSNRLSERSTAAWLALLGESGVPCGPVNDVSQAFADKQAAARHSIVEVEHDVLGTVRQPASPLRLDDDAPTVHRAPYLGEHTREVLIEICGLASRELDSLMADGVIEARQAEADAASARSAL